MIVLVSAGAVALLRPLEVRERASSPEKQGPIPEQALQATGVTAESDAAITGTVLERIDVQKYTYLRLERSGADPVWVAVSAAPVQVGERVSVRDAQLMKDFTSPTLKRTFDVIYFGVLDAPGAGEQGTSPHGMLKAEGANPHQGMVVDPAAAESPAVQAAHLQPYQPSKTVEVGNVRKAEGALGRSIAEIHSQGRQLQGKRARVRGVVVKSVPGVLGKTFVHVRDGSGNSDSTGDLTVTTDATPALGSRVLFEGTVEIDKDFGSGYRYAVVLENAKEVGE